MGVAAKRRLISLCYNFIMKKEEINLFDIHSHLHSKFFKEDLGEVLEKMREKKVWTISVGVDFEDSKKAVELAEKNKNIFATIGIHPTEKEYFNEEEFQKLLESSEKIVGIGECGLDYYWPKKDLESGKIGEADFAAEITRQKKLFEKQIDFGVKNNLPLMLHIRSFENADAHWDAFEILDQKQKEHKGKIRANFHFFTEGPEIIEEIIKRNFSISLPGVITFANLNESIKKIPLENLMIETDSPFAAPKPFRGKTNLPIYVEEVARKISEVKNIDFEEIKKISTKNALSFWKI